jgi:hypothetical protein
MISQSLKGKSMLKKEEKKKKKLLNLFTLNSVHVRHIEWFRHLFLMEFLKSLETYSLKSMVVIV